MRAGLTLTCVAVCTNGQFCGPGTHALSSYEIKGPQAHSKGGQPNGAALCVNYRPADSQGHRRLLGMEGA